MSIYKTVSPQSENPIKVVETSATTFGELKADLAANGVQYEGMAITLKSNKMSLTLDEAILPEGDQVLYITPTKVKSGYFEEYEFNDMGSDESLAAFAGAVKEHITRLEGMIELLIRGVQAQAAAVQTAPVAVVAPVVETPRLSAEDQALIDEALGLGTSSQVEEEPEEDEDYDY